MAENVIPPHHNDSQEANCKAEATKKDHLRALPIPPGKFQELSPAEITVHAGLLQGDSKRLKCFQSKGFLLRSISSTMQPIQIIHFIYEIEIYLKLKQDWETLPPDRSFVIKRYPLEQPTSPSLFLYVRKQLRMGKGTEFVCLISTQPMDDQKPA